MRKTYRSFYRKLVEMDLPLLCHVGAEHSIPVPAERKGRDDWKKKDWMYTMLNRPDVLRPALEAGVIVIAAHCSLPVWDSDPDYTYEFIRLMYTANENRWNLYADLSALALPRLLCPKRYKSARKIAEEKGIHERLLLRSDFSVVVRSVIPELSDRLDLEELSDLLGTSNPLDRNVKWLRRLGFSQAVFERGVQLLGLTT